MVAICIKVVSLQVKRRSFGDPVSIVVWGEGGLACLAAMQGLPQMTGEGALAGPVAWKDVRLVSVIIDGAGEEALVGLAIGSYMSLAGL